MIKEWFTDYFLHASDGTLVDSCEKTMTGGRFKRNRKYIGDETFMLSYMVLVPGIFELIEGDKTFSEHEPLEQLAVRGELMPFSHEDSWQCMDTKHDLDILESLWEEGLEFLAVLI